MNRRESLKTMGAGALAAAGVPLAATAEPFEWRVAFAELPGEPCPLALIQTNDPEQALRLIRPVDGIAADPRPAIEFVGKDILLGATVKSVSVNRVWCWGAALPASIGGEGRDPWYIVVVDFAYSATFPFLVSDDMLAEAPWVLDSYRELKKERAAQYFGVDQSRLKFTWDESRDENHWAGPSTRHTLTAEVA